MLLFTYFYSSSVNLRQPDGTPIQLLHLATHTSGLPNYSWDSLLVFAEKYQPHNVGDKYYYSNMGYCLLGLALQRMQANFA